MSHAILIGYWYSAYEPHYPHPAEMIDTSYSDPQLVEYLNSGIQCNEYRGSSTCRFCGISNGSREKTDGDCIWPVGLAHYVEHHHVKLPQEFLDHVKENNYKIPELACYPRTESIEHNFSLWNEYSDPSRKLSTMDNYIFGYSGGKDTQWITDFLRNKGFNVIKAMVEERIALGPYEIMKGYKK